MEDNQNSINQPLIGRLPKSLTTVTAFSKLIALFLFALLPLAGFMVGSKFQAKLDSSKTLNVISNSPPTPNQPEITDTSNWKTFSNTKFSIKYPPNWIISNSFESDPENGLLSFKSADGVYADERGNLMKGFTVSLSSNTGCVEAILDGPTAGHRRVQRLDSDKEGYFVEHGLESLAYTMIPDRNIDMCLSMGVPSKTGKIEPFLNETFLKNRQDLITSATTFKFLKPTVFQTQTIDASNWKTYTKDSDFSFKYPNNYELEEVQTDNPGVNYIYVESSSEKTRVEYGPSAKSVRYDRLEKAGNQVVNGIVWTTISHYKFCDRGVCNTSSVGLFAKNAKFYVIINDISLVQDPGYWNIISTFNFEN